MHHRFLTMIFRNMHKPLSSITQRWSHKSVHWALSLDSGSMGWVWEIPITSKMRSSMYLTRQTQDRDGSTSNVIHHHLFISDKALVLGALSQHSELLSCWKNSSFGFQMPAICGLSHASSDFLKALMSFTRTSWVVVRLFLTMRAMVMWRKS